jgi:hypothetical protein
MIEPRGPSFALPRPPHPRARSGCAPDKPAADPQKPQQPTPRGHGQAVGAAAPELAGRGTAAGRPGPPPACAWATPGQTPGQTQTPPPQARPQNPNTPPASPPPAGQNVAQPGTTSRSKIPPIQDVGNEYVLTFDETGAEDALTLEAFVKICQETTGLNFTYTDETRSDLNKKKLRTFGQKRIPKTDFYSFFQIMMIINDFVCSRIGPSTCR